MPPRPFEGPTGLGPDTVPPETAVEEPLHDAREVARQMRRSLLSKTGYDVGRSEGVG